MSPDVTEYDLGALAHKLETTLAKFEELPAVEAERRRLASMIEAHEATVAEWASEIARLKDAIDRLDPQSPKHIHQPAPHPHRELDSIPVLETGLRLVKDQIAVLKESAVPQHPHSEFADGSLTRTAIERVETRIQMLEERMDGAVLENNHWHLTVAEHLRSPHVAPGHPHADLSGGLMRLANEMAEQQVTLQDQITNLAERMADTQSLVAELGNQTIALGERIDEELKAIRSAISGHERVMQGLSMAVEETGKVSIQMQADVLDLQDRKADRVHNHDVNKDIAEPGQRHKHEMVVRERIGNRRVLRCDVPGCVAEWAEVD